MRKIGTFRLLGTAVLTAWVFAFVPTLSLAQRIEKKVESRREESLSGRPISDAQRKALRRAFGYEGPDAILHRPSGSDAFSKAILDALRGPVEPKTDRLRTPPGSPSDSGARALRGPSKSRALLRGRSESVVGIPRERFQFLPTGEARLRIGDASYDINPSMMIQIQDAVRDGFASDAGFVVQRLQPTDGNVRPAFLLYLGKGPLQEFVGLEGLGPLGATATFARYDNSGRWGQVPVTFLGGTALDLDAARLTMVLRSQRDGLAIGSAADDMFTFPTEGRYRPFGARPAGLSMDRMHVGRDGSVSWVVGKAKIAVKSTKFSAVERVAHACAAIWYALVRALVAFNPSLVISDDSPRINHAAFGALPLEVQRKLINAAVTDARRIYDDLRKQQSQTEPDDGKIDVEIEIGDQKASVRFAGLQLFPAIVTAERRQANGSH